VLGVEEHLRRIELYQRLAASHNEADAFRLRMAALNSCQAMISIMLEAATKDELTVAASTNDKWNTFKEELRPWFPYFDLIEKLRIHDFHRFGLLPPREGVTKQFFGGPVKLIAQRGTAVVVLAPGAPKSSVTGNSTVRGQRALVTSGGTFFDEVSASHVSPETVIDAFREAAPAAIAKFKARLRYRPDGELAPEGKGGSSA
jgi:hypothetical protein